VNATGFSGATVRPGAGPDAGAASARGFPARGVGADSAFPGAAGSGDCGLRSRGEGVDDVADRLQRREIRSAVAQTGLSFPGVTLKTT